MAGVTVWHTRATTHVSKIELVVRHKETRTYITQVILGVNWIILNINMSSYYGELSSSSKLQRCLRGPNKDVSVCVCVGECAEIANIRWKTRSRCCWTSKSHCSVRITAAEGKVSRYTHTESSDQPTRRPTDRYIRKICVTWNMICQPKKDITRIKYSFYAFGFISSTYVPLSAAWIYYSEHGRSTRSLVSSRLISLRFTLSHFCSFYFNNFLLAFIVSMHSCVRSVCARAPCPHIQRSSDPNRYRVDKQMCVLPPILLGTDTPSSINYLWECLRCFTELNRVLDKCVVYEVRGYTF